MKKEIKNEKHSMGYGSERKQSLGEGREGTMAKTWPEKESERKESEGHGRRLFLGLEKRRIGFF